MVFCLLPPAPFLALAMVVKSISSALFLYPSQCILIAASPLPLLGIFTVASGPGPTLCCRPSFLATHPSCLSPPSGLGWGLWAAYGMRRIVGQLSVYFAFWDPLWGFTAPLWSHLKGDFLVCGNFSFFMTPSLPRGTNSCPEVLCLSFLNVFLSSYLIPGKLVCLFGGLGSSVVI